MEENSIQKLTADFINRTSCHIFLTGKAGTGKTTFLRNIPELTYKNIAIVAPTGIAAINAGGVTIHSMFQLPFGTFVPTSDFNIPQHLEFSINTPQSLVRDHAMTGQKRQVIRELDLLIIDEVSMLRADILDAIDTVMRFVRGRKKSHLPFGGVQLLFIGDLLQLPPVVKDNEWNVLKHFYRSIFFFEAHALKQSPPVYMELEKIYRQSDPKFISLLSNLRNDQIRQTDIDLLNSHFKRGFQPADDEGYIFLTTHNRKADSINFKKLDELDEKPHIYKASIKGDFGEKLYPMDEVLVLKAGAQVMFTKNDPSGEGRYFNGRIGTVEKLRTDAIFIRCDENYDLIEAERYEWENIRYVLNEETNEVESEVIGTFVHYPLKLAWAITVHKSQGLTFDKAILDINSVFAPGQAYVALSRLRSLDGLVLKAPFRVPAIGKNKEVESFSQTKAQAHKLNSTLLSEETRFIGATAIDAFNLSATQKLMQTHLQESEHSGPNSNLRKGLEWFNEIFDEFGNLNKVASTFSNQIFKITEMHSAKSTGVLHERLQAANDYFLPRLKGLNEKILSRMADLKHFKGTKAYFEKLKSIEKSVFRCRFHMVKAYCMAEASAQKLEFSKHSLMTTPLFKERDEEMRTFDDMLAAPTSEQQKKQIGKQDTKEISYEMLKQGLSVAQIAEQRGLSATTISAHLTHFITTGRLDVAFVLDEKKHEEIKRAIEEAGTDKLSPLKAILGENYSFEEIKYAVADYLYKQSENVINTHIQEDNSTNTITGS